MQRLWVLLLADSANMVLPVVLACVIVGSLAGGCWAGQVGAGVTLCSLSGWWVPWQVLWPQEMGERVPCGTPLPGPGFPTLGAGLCHSRCFQQGVPSPRRSCWPPLSSLAFPCLPPPRHEWESLENPSCMSRTLDIFDCSDLSQPPQNPGDVRHPFYDDSTELLPCSEGFLPSAGKGASSLALPLFLELESVFSIPSRPKSLAK